MDKLQVINYVSIALSDINFMIVMLIIVMILVPLLVFLFPILLLMVKEPLLTWQDQKICEYFMLLLIM